MFSYYYEYLTFSNQIQITLSKLCIALNNIIKGKQTHLVLGNIDAKRDWGHAKDYIYGMWLMLQQQIPDDFILSTNETHSVREFVEKAFALKKFELHT